MINLQSGNINAITAEFIIEECIRNGVNQFYISPGSRSTALTIAAVENKKANIVICPDERGAAYACLGFSKAANSPAALICTSGTAVANYFPAIIEAYNDRIPMLVLSADRPSELKNTQSNQTIDQSKIFGAYVKFFADIDCSDFNSPIENILGLIDNAIYFSKYPNAGAVHLNCSFREPLYGNFNQKIQLKSTTTNYINSQEPFTSYSISDKNVSKNDIEKLLIILNNSKKTLLILGKCSSISEAKSVVNFAEKYQIPFFADILSQAKYFESELNINAYDLLVDKIKSNENIPDLIIHFGDRFVSKKLQQFLDKHKNKFKYIVINRHSFRQDPSHICDYKYEANIVDLCANLCAKLVNFSIDSGYVDKWIELNNSAFSLIKSEYYNRFDEISIPYYLLNSIDDENALFIGNSMPIRYFDMLPSKTGKSITISANRGASGIDGVIASAVGFAQGSKRRTTLVIGDVSAFHDMNSLRIAANSKIPLTIIIIDNDGGGIFHYLSVANYENFDYAFATPPGVNFEFIAKAFSLNCKEVSAEKDFLDAYSIAQKSDKTSIIIIKTDRASAIDQKKSLDKMIAEMMENL
jgi:2-succinyl-5-enolpyruvyl-6-hydroxy-3-cyclohexene-1-carboxylate synthase